MNKVMIDSNVFLYFLLGTFPDSKCRDGIVLLFEAVEHREIEGVTTTRIVDEVIFKLLLAKARETYPNKPLHHRKSDPQFAKSLHGIHEEFFRFAEDFGIAIVPTTLQHLRHSGTLLKAFGIFGNDALTLEAMLTHNITRIATCDCDFERIELVEMWL